MTAAVRHRKQNNVENVRIRRPLSEKYKLDLGRGMARSLFGLFGQPRQAVGSLQLFHNQCLIFINPVKNSLLEMRELFDFVQHRVSDGILMCPCDKMHGGGRGPVGSTAHDFPYISLGPES